MTLHSSDPPASLGHPSSAPASHRIPPNVEATRWIALASLLGLIGLGLGWELWWAPTGSGTLALKVVPLLAPLPGLWRRRMYTYRWLSLLVWLYFTEGAVRATSEAGLGQILAMVELGLCLVLFTACALHVRWRLVAAKAMAAVPAVNGSHER